MKEIRRMILYDRRTGEPYFIVNKERWYFKNIPFSYVY